MLPDPILADALLALTRRQLARKAGLVVMGICGAQGSGKSTLARWLADRLSDEGIASAQVSLDDFYLTRSEREKLAREVHPLFATRGVPGTHDIALALRVIDDLERGEPVALPHFVKAEDDRAPQDNWPLAPKQCRVLVFEGWCLGAAPQPEVDLVTPVNALESLEDPDGNWRRYANLCLAGEYQRLFARLDILAMLAAPSFSIVEVWRQQQERDIAGTGAKVMDTAGIARFIRFYQRLTEWMLIEMPSRVDLLARLGEVREVVSLECRAAT